MSSQLYHLELQKIVKKEIDLHLHEYRPSLAKTTGVMPGQQLPTTGNTGSGYTPAPHDINSADHTGFPLTAAHGGTGQTTYAVGDLLYASGATALSKLADIATGNALLSGGVGIAPLWGKVGLTSHVTGVLPSANGGTGVNNAGTLTNGSNTTITGGGTLTLAGFTFTVPATGTGALKSGTPAATYLAVFSDGNTITGNNQLTWSAGLLTETHTTTLAANIGDDYAAALRLTPTYTGAFTVTRHAYLDINNVTLAGGAAVTDAVFARFNAAPGTHKAIDTGTTKATPGTVDAWLKVNVDGAIFYQPLYTDKTT